jgi:hypothetical protein
MGAFGWDRLVNGVKISPAVRQSFEFFCDPKSRNKRIHITMIGDAVSLCKNAENHSGCDDITQFNPSNKKNLCRNCGRVMLAMQDPDKVHDDIVKRAKKTLSRPEATVKHKRLEAHKKSLSKTKADFMEALEKTENTTIRLPDEIGPEEHSLNEALKLATPIITAVRKSAVLNLDRVMNEWRKLPPNSNQEFTLVQQAQHLKHLIIAIDQIKSFPKQT